MLIFKLLLVLVSIVVDTSVVVPIVSVYFPRRVTIVCWIVHLRANVIKVLSTLQKPCVTYSLPLTIVPANSIAVVSIVPVIVSIVIFVVVVVVVGVFVIGSIVVVVVLIGVVILVVVSFFCVLCVT